jgi:hypothetical protein
MSLCKFVRPENDNKLPGERCHKPANRGERYCMWHIPCDHGEPASRCKRCKPGEKQTVAKKLAPIKNRRAEISDEYVEEIEKRRRSEGEIPNIREKSAKSRQIDQALAIMAQLTAAISK